jgi:hypothetical protein
MNGDCAAGASVFTLAVYQGLPVSQEIGINAFRVLMILRMSSIMKCNTLVREVVGKHHKAHKGHKARIN